MAVAVAVDQSTCTIPRQKISHQPDLGQIVKTLYPNLPFAMALDSYKSMPQHQRNAALARHFPQYQAAASSPPPTTLDSTLKPKPVTITLPKPGYFSTPPSAASPIDETFTRTLQSRLWKLAQDLEANGDAARVSVTRLELPHPDRLDDEGTLWQEVEIKPSAADEDDDDLSPFMRKLRERQRGRREMLKRVSEEKAAWIYKV